MVGHLKIQKCQTSSLTRVWELPQLFFLTVRTEINRSKANYIDTFLFQLFLCPIIAHGTDFTGLTPYCINNFLKITNLIEHEKRIIGLKCTEILMPKGFFFNH